MEDTYTFFWRLKGIVPRDFLLFAAGVIDTGGNLPPVSLILVANLLPVSTIPAVPVTKFAADIVDTEGKFATGVIDTSKMPFSGAWEKMIP